MLDHTAYPHILDRVIATARPESLITLRRASRWLRGRIDPVLFRHIRITEREHDPDEVVLDITTPCGVVLPSFERGVYLADCADRRSDPGTVGGRGERCVPAPVPLGAVHEALLRMTEYIDFVPRKGERGRDAQSKLRDFGDGRRDAVLRVFVDQDERTDADCPMTVGQARMVSLLTVSTSKPSLVSTTPPPHRRGDWEGVDSLILNVRYGPHAWAPVDTLILREWPVTLTQVVYVFTYDDAGINDVSAPAPAPVLADHVMGFFRDLVRPLVGNTYVSYAFVGVQHAVPRHLRPSDIFGEMAEAQGPDTQSDSIPLGQRVLLEALRLECEARRLGADDQKEVMDGIAFLSREEMRGVLGDDMYALATEWPDVK